MKNKFGKESRLYIRAKVSDGKTCLQDSYFTAPFKIAKPFYEGHGGFMNLMVMSASAELWRVTITGLKWNWTKAQE